MIWEAIQWFWLAGTYVTMGAHLFIDHRRRQQPSSSAECICPPDVWTFACPVHPVGKGIPPDGTWNGHPPSSSAVATGPRSGCQHPNTMSSAPTRPNALMWCPDCLKYVLRAEG